MNRPTIEFICILVSVLIVRFIYYPGRQSKNFEFTFLGFNTVIYFVVSSLSSAELGVGVGFGLFAIFSVLRYRTMPMSAREMTYLFVVIALPVIGVILMQSGNVGLFLGVGAVVSVVLYVLEREWGFRYEGVKAIKYERIELVRPENYDELLADLRQRTGLPITRVEIGRVNFITDSAELQVYFDSRAVPQRHFVAEALLICDDD